MYIAHLKGNYSEALPTPLNLNKKVSFQISTCML